MNRTLLALTVAAQLAASAAFAQTDPAAGTASDLTVGNYGSDWSSSVGTALMGDDGTTIRPTTELTTQWQTLSEADKEIVRRDCMIHMQTTAGMETSTTGATTTDTTTGMATDSTTGTATDSTATTATGTDSTASTGLETAPMSVTAEQMDQICAGVSDL